MTFGTLDKFGDLNANRDNGSPNGLHHLVFAGRVFAPPLVLMQRFAESIEFVTDLLGVHVRTTKRNAAGPAKEWQRFKWACARVLVLSSRD